MRGITSGALKWRLSAALQTWKITAEVPSPLGREIRKFNVPVHQLPSPINAVHGTSMAIINPNIRNGTLIADQDTYITIDPLIAGCYARGRSDAVLLKVVADESDVEIDIDTFGHPKIKQGRKYPLFVSSIHLLSEEFINHTPVKLKVRLSETKKSFTRVYQEKKFDQNVDSDSSIGKTVIDTALKILNRVKFWIWQ